MISFQKLVKYLEKKGKLLTWVGNTKDLWTPISRFLWSYELLFHTIYIA
jgi:hypothetical protein